MNDTNQDIHDYVNNVKCAWVLTPWYLFWKPKYRRWVMIFDDTDPYTTDYGDKDHWEYSDLNEENRL